MKVPISGRVNTSSMASTARRLQALGLAKRTRIADRTRAVRARARSINANLGRRNDDHLAVVRRINTELADIAERVARQADAVVRNATRTLRAAGEAASGKARALVVNSGNANAFTGKAGVQAVKLTAALAAKATGAPATEIFLASTGVIGEPLDASKFDGVLETLAERATPNDLLEAAQAIMTTDTYPKVATAGAALAGVEVILSGMAKGAGMIAPDMATMLAFVFTDAPNAATALQSMLAKSVQRSFNAITIDGDTSTSDTLMLFATGAAAKRGAPRIVAANDRRLAPFKQALDRLLLDLAHQVVGDGEGARKFVEVKVTRAATAAAAKKIAFSIANSPLVKTAIAGEDANWGRVVMAVGKAGVPAERDRLAIWFNDVRVAHKGQRDTAYDEPEVSNFMRGARITQQCWLEGSMAGIGPI